MSIAVTRLARGYVALPICVRLKFVIDSVGEWVILRNLSPSAMFTSMHLIFLTLKPKALGSITIGYRNIRVMDQTLSLETASEGRRGDLVS